VAAWLVGGISLVPAAVRLMLGERSERLARHPVALLALQRARFFRGTATAAVAGVVASLALCVALTVMVASFREAVTAWLDTILPADLYLRVGNGGGRGAGQAFLPDGLEVAVAALPGVQRTNGGRGVPLSLTAEQPAVWLQSRRLGAHPEQALPLVAPALPLPAGQTGVFVSEAMVALYGAAPGQTLALPLAAAGPADGAAVEVFVRGVWRDYARQFGSIAIDRADYQRLTGDARLNDLAVWTAPGTALAPLEDAIRAEVARAGASPQALVFASTAQLKAMSLRIFDRSFAVTRYLQVVAIAIGLAGVATSLSAQVLARRREFGLLAHLGFTRAQVLRLVMAETAGWLAAGVLVGLALGLAISAVLVFVVNPQSFHWTMDWRVPPGAVAALLGAVLAAGLGTSALAARHALSADAVRAVKEDW
jgi:putative ABC transport system permease protein